MNIEWNRDQTLGKSEHAYYRLSQRYCPEPGIEERRWFVDYQAGAQGYDPNAYLGRLKIRLVLRPKRKRLPLARKAQSSIKIISKHSRPLSISEIKNSSCGFLAHFRRLSGIQIRIRPSSEPIRFEVRLRRLDNRSRSPYLIRSGKRGLRRSQATVRRSGRQAASPAFIQSISTSRRTIASF
jgi:hypothetical protein